MSHSLDLICLGELLVDFVPSRAGTPIARAKTISLAPGGAPANVAVAARRLGLRSGFVGKVGDDPFGRLLRDVLVRHGVDVTLLGRTRHSLTRLAFVTNDTDDRQRFVFYGNPGADVLLEARDLRADYFKGARAFHFGSISLIQNPSRAATLKALELAQRNGLMVSFDPNLRPPLWPSLRLAKQEILEAMKHCHILKLSDSEWDFLFAGRSFASGLERLWKQEIQFVAITRGREGALVACPRAVVHVKALPVKVVDTTGAGDGFMAGLICGLLQKQGSDLDELELQEIARLATLVGSLTCRRAGAIPAFPALQEVKRHFGQAEKIRLGSAVHFGNK